MKPFLGKLLLFTAIALFYLVPGEKLSAQVSLGMNVGITSTRLDGDPVSFNLYKPHIGWNIGASININLTRDIVFSLQPGVLYAYGRIQTADTVQGPLNIRLIYRDSVNIGIGAATLPILLKVVTDNRRFEFFSGVDLNYLLGASWNDGNEKIDISSHLHDFNLSLLFGIGYRIPIKDTRLVTSLMYIQGLTNLSGSSGDIPETHRLKGRGFRFQLEWTLPVIRKKGRRHAE